MAKQQSNLPVISKGRDVSVEDKIAIAKKVCDRYAEDKYTLDDCLRSCGIGSHRTWGKWCNEIPEIAALYNESKILKRGIYDIKIEERAKTSLERALDGYTVELQDEVGEVRTDKDGNQVIVTTGIRKRQVYIPPKVQAIVFTLTNVDKTNYQRNPKFVDSDIDKAPTDISITVVGGSVQPVISEDDIFEDIG